MRAFRGTIEVLHMKSVLVLSEGLLSRVVYRDKEKVAWGTIRVLMETNCFNNGTAEVQGGQVRVLRISRDFRGTVEGIK